MTNENWPILKTQLAQSGTSLCLTYTNFKKIVLSIRQKKRPKNILVIYICLQLNKKSQSIIARK